MSPSSDQKPPSSPSIPEKNSVAATNVASHVAPIQSAVNDSVQASQEMYTQSKREIKNVVEFTRETIHSAGSKAYKSTRSFIRPIKQIFEDAESEKGTILRRQIAIAREHVNVQAYRAQIHMNETKRFVCQQTAPLRVAWTKAKKQTTEMSNFARAHPSTALVSAAVVTGVPSLVLRMPQQ
uniref:Uncharacterized protein AlNc14C10G1295 n=1 Tax=Albugo laibachii Nc14 TaxID=890382 RepID=F0W2Q7_9STRA|nr:conserved hypothetical protein [Albugo laibachii Nc14]|eukprot:CCA15343.1 conserved hypothetical protein [Albugo laibachii Nc14]